MTATNHTEHYGLSQYTEDDRPTYTGDYNGDMSKIDAAIHAAAAQSGGLTDNLANLISRVEALESKVSQLTTDASPSTTGLTATQLDTQYSDNYNIVRVGPPTRNVESEETSHE